MDVLAGGLQQECDRAGRRGGGVAVYVSDQMKMTKWEQLEEEHIETKWITVRPNKLPRQFSIMIIGVIYHPPSDPQYPMIRHIQSSLERMLQKHPNAAIILAGDLNKLNTASISSGFKLKQIVNCPTRGKNTLDKILTNMQDYYLDPYTVGKIGTSDHEAVLAVPAVPKAWEPPKRITIYSRHASFDQRCQVADALRAIPWEHLYMLPTCEQQYTLFQETMSDIINTKLCL